MLNPDFLINKQQIASSFAAAANSYDAHASVQRYVADELLGRMQTNTDVRRVLDLGSGTGYCTQKLLNLYPNAEIISLDLADAMLNYARQAHKNRQLSEVFICADAENLPFQNHSIDLIFSSLAIQWCHDVFALFAGLKKVLKPGGKLHVASFGPGTLKELELAWRQIDSAVHVNHFDDEQRIRQALQENSFMSIKLQHQTEVHHYPSLTALKNELKSIGARNMNAGRMQGLIGRKKLQKLVNAFEKNAVASLGIPVTYQVQFISAQS
jgi:malonyl-CoA O-methyltransferase